MAQDSTGHARATRHDQEQEALVSAFHVGRRHPGFVITCMRIASRTEWAILQKERIVTTTVHAIDLEGGVVNPAIRRPAVQAA